MVWWEEEGEKMNPVKRILGDRWSKNNDSFSRAQRNYDAQEPDDDNDKKFCHFCKKKLRRGEEEMCNNCLNTYGSKVHYELRMKKHKEI
jgi:hypothetical protein